VQCTNVARGENLRHEPFSIDLTIALMTQCCRS
jgi:hypothetical protein